MLLGTSEGDSPSGWNGGRCEAYALLAIHEVCWLDKDVSNEVDIAEIGEQDDVQPILAVAVGVDEGAKTHLPDSGL